ncbi:MAG: transglutaminase-like domain-containing protein [bacterium]|nr:transglutaminase-like domain-containing protein [bacterium]MCM1376487.1 transglutaminase-like domain-containing protein [Muribaculum sp.]
MNEAIYQRYLETSIYTDAGYYKELLLSLPDDIPTIGILVCDQITHPSMYFTEPSSYLENTYFGKFSSYPKQRFKNEDELYITAVSMIAGILRLDGVGFTRNRDVTKRITVSCRQASVLFSAILKAKGIPCRSRAGFMDFGNTGDSYMEHWVNEYWDFQENRWILADVDGYYEYEPRFGYSQFDLPRRKFVTASEAWLGARRNTLEKKLDVFSPTLLDGVCDYLFMDFHALMNNEIFYSYQPLYLRGGTQTLSEDELRELDDLAELLAEPDQNMEQLEYLQATNEKLSILTNNTQNIYHDIFG